MSDNNLESKFPDMRPVKSAPALSTINGIGCAVYGSRDFDEETNTYVKTHGLCVLFIPLINLGAYRVADSPNGGWYFIGRVPLSAAARLWNMVLVAAIVIGVGATLWYNHTHSPEYLAGQKVDEADALAKSGKVVKAAQLYADVGRGSTPHAATAVVKFNQLLDRPLQQAAPADAAVVLGLAMDLKDRFRINNLFEHGAALAKKHAADPHAALDLLDKVAAAAPDEAALAKVRKPLLEALVAKEPQEAQWASRLAEIYEASGQPAKCETLLFPHLKRLGTLEGARILGQIYARRSKIEEAHALLVPYAEGRLKEYHDAEESARRAVTRIQEQLRVHAPESLMKRYQQANKAEQHRLVDEYIQQQLEADPAYRAALATIKQNRHIVGVALDLGMVILYRAQAMADPAARRKELEKAEKTFLAVQGQAGGSDAYRLNLGQVYYWLGKHAEGHKLFEQLLKSRQRQPDTLIMVSQLLREVGETSEARTLAEEAYHTETNHQKQMDIAGYVAILVNDVDDKIAWLGKANSAKGSIKALLANTLGYKAKQEGKDEEAATHYRESIAEYDRLPENAATLNNSAGAYTALYFVTGEPTALEKCRERFEKALALEPRDSIILSNVANATSEAGLRDLIGNAIDLKILRMEGSLNLLGYLYKDSAGKDRYTQRLRHHAELSKARAYFNRFILLAPKNASAYSTLVSLDEFANDLGALKSLWQRLEKVDLDLAEQVRKTKESYAGKKDAEQRKILEGQIRRGERALKAARDGPRGITLAVAATSLASYKSGLAPLGGAVDADDIVRLAEEGDAASSSRATRFSLINALLFRADRALAQQQPTYAAMAKRATRSLGPNYLIAIAQSRDDQLRQAVLANKDVQRALTLLLEDRKSFPDDTNEWAWAMLAAAHPKEAAAVAKVIQRDEVNRVRRDIDLKVSPFSPNTAFQAYWATQIAPEEAKGDEILKRCAAYGVPMPFDVK